MQQVRYNLSASFRAPPDILHVFEYLDTFFGVGNKVGDEIGLVDVGDAAEEQDTGEL